MAAPVYAIPEGTLRRLERFLDHFEGQDCPHRPTMSKAIDPTPRAAAHEPLPPFQTIGDLAVKVVDDAAQRRRDQT